MEGESEPSVRRVYTVAVRELCEFAAKTGDLDHRFTPSPSAQEGMAGNKTVAARRDASRRSEVVVAGDFKELRVRGRADGFDQAGNLLEEVKTYRGQLDRMPANHRALHWAQAKVYGALLCKQLALPELNISLVYFEISRQEETALVERCSAEELRGFFQSLCESFLAWGTQEFRHRQRRDAALTALRFPYATYRSGQRQLAENVFRAARHGRALMVQAPTGIGKTIGTIFPLLKACALEELDKVFFLTAKGSGQGLATEAIATLRREHSSHLPLRVIEMVSREKSCEHPGNACHGESCPLARGFYDRLPAAREAAIARGGPLERQTLRRIAMEYQVCPYYLTQELVRWSDVIVADYNYFFDSSALLFQLTLANEWKVAVLVDEAHNLLDRGRAMYSCNLSQARFNEARTSAPPALKAPLTRLHRAWCELSRKTSTPYSVLAQIPKRYANSLGDASAAITIHLAEAPGEIDACLLSFYFDALRFNRLAESFGSHSIFDVSLAKRDSRRASLSDLCIRNVIPGSYLKPRYAAARTTVLFSATLSPQHFYADTLGLENTAWLEIEAPFEASQLSVRVVGDIATRWSERPQSLAPIARLMALHYARQSGNYLAFFSSFDYMERCAEVFRLMHPAIASWTQARRADDAERASFLAHFVPNGSGVGFAVLGGAFAEGIDLPGSRLIGAFVVTLGLPQINPVNEEMRRRMQATFGAGYEYTYLFPGLRKVVQAAGRVIRTPTDRGSLFLIDERFGKRDVRALLPGWWRVVAEPSH
jgi:DNA excision repair protein ERCC-2